MLSHRDDILDLIVERLGRFPVDFSEKMDLMEKRKKGSRVQPAAGVLLLLSYRGKRNEGDFFFQLIKRASGVPQAGDIGCPGGLLNPFLDPFLRLFIVHKFSPILRGDALEYARKRGKTACRNITLFLANALRESWEELRINPFRVVFLGPLPSRDLISFERTIFPLAGYVKDEKGFRPNREVEKIVEIPLRTFFEDGNYGLCRLETTPGKVMEKIDNNRCYPCFIYHDEVLWGATFDVVLNFLKIVFDFKLPESHTERIVKKKLYADYLTGRPK